MTHARALPRIVPGRFLAPGLRLGVGVVAGLLAGLALPSAAAGQAVADPAAGAAIQVRDDQGRAVSLAAPARRAVTLAPHATELVYAAGAGDRIAATIRGSDYPPAARQLPVIGDGTQPDPERVAAVRPDLLIAWQPAAAAPLARVMDKLGVPVFYSDPLT
ncbi:ABC transporter substrate-binding protein, partial [Achromobacter sp.]|uniref:ABC transporter substrate-binding protein n=1 Tax=Achromobacter sp. TaxID=134375 RepID=UPI003C792467